jgi:hypothetical protein
MTVALTRKALASFLIAWRRNQMYQPAGVVDLSLVL